MFKVTWRPDILRLYWFPIILTLVGCSAYLEPAEYRALVASDQITLHHDLASLAYQSATISQYQKLELGGSRNVCDFGSGPTLYEGFEIPEGSVTTRVDALFSGYAQADEHITFPTLLFLDTSFLEISRVPSEMTQGAAGNGATLFTHEMPIPDQARYLVVFVDPEAAPSSITWGYVGFSGGGALQGVGGRQVRADVGLGGPIRVRFDSQ